MISPKSEPTLDLHSRAAPSVEAHHHSGGPDKGRNSGGRRIKKCVINLNATKIFIVTRINVIKYKSKSSALKQAEISTIW